jgi:hypothetical protein
MEEAGKKVNFETIQWTYEKQVKKRYREEAQALNDKVLELRAFKDKLSNHITKG